MSKPRFAKPNAQGRNKEPRGRFVRLDHEILNSPAYQSLTPAARSLLVEIVKIYDGKNNGDLGISESKAATLIGVKCRKVAARAYGELSNVGLISCTKDAFFHIKTGERRARRWRLTWLFNHVDRKPATNDWRDFALGHASENSPPSEPSKNRITRGNKDPMKEGHEVMRSKSAHMKNPNSQETATRESSHGGVKRTSNSYAKGCEIDTLAGPSSCTLSPAFRIAANQIFANWLSTAADCGVPSTDPKSVPHELKRWSAARDASVRPTQADVNSLQVATWRQ